LNAPPAEIRNAPYHSLRWRGSVAYLLFAQAGGLLMFHLLSHAKGEIGRDDDRSAFVEMGQFSMEIPAQSSNQADADEMWI
jgi:hypothetical protein